jgi:hypothetical protein
MAFLATDLRPPRADGGERITRLAAETGALGIHLAGGCDLEILAGAPLVSAALRLGLEIPSVSLPLAERILPAGRRLPRLGAPARDEREAAIALAVRGLAAAGSFGARAAVVDFGPVALTADPAAFTLAFARRAVGPDDPGGEMLALALAERRARAPEILDACQWALERLLRAADRAGLRLAVQVGVTPWQSPSPREVGILRETFGASFGVAWDPGRLSLLGALDLPVADDRLKSLAAAAVLVIENDAVGIETGYLPGLGERDGRLAAFAPPGSALRIVTGGPGSTDAEVASGIAGVVTPAAITSGPAAPGAG